MIISLYHFQDISHLLTSLFKNVYTGEIIGKDTGANLIRSKGGDNPHHQKFVEELQQVGTVFWALTSLYCV